MKTSFFLKIFLSILFFYSANSYAKNVQHKVKQDVGMIGCVNEKLFRDVIKYSLEKKVNEVQILIATNQCFYLPKNTIIEAKDKACGKNSKETDVEKFYVRSVKKHLFMPCAVL